LFHTEQLTTETRGSEYSILLTAILFEELPIARANIRWLASEILQKINYCEIPSGTSEDSRCRNAVYRFCAAPELDLWTITLALQVIRAPWWHLDDINPEPDPLNNVAWVYNTLEKLYYSPNPTQLDRMSFGERIYHFSVGDLLQVLVRFKPILKKTEHECPACHPLGLVVSS
jgi:hypothetical protein